MRDVREAGDDRDSKSTSFESIGVSCFDAGVSICRGEVPIEETICNSEGSTVLSVDPHVAGAVLCCGAVLVCDYTICNGRNVQCVEDTESDSSNDRQEEESNKCNDVDALSPAEVLAAANDSVTAAGGDSVHGVLLEDCCLGAYLPC